MIYEGRERNKRISLEFMYISFKHIHPKLKKWNRSSVKSVSIVYNIICNISIPFILIIEAFLTFWYLTFDIWNLDFDILHFLKRLPLHNFPLAIMFTLFFIITFKLRKWLKSVFLPVSCPLGRSLFEKKLWSNVRL